MADAVRFYVEHKGVIPSWARNLTIHLQKAQDERNRIFNLLAEATGQGSGRFNDADREILRSLLDDLVDAIGFANTSGYR